MVACSRIFGFVLLMSAGGAMAAETIAYRYDAKGRLIRVTRTGSVNNGVVTAYMHDRANNRIRVNKTGSR